MTSCESSPHSFRLIGSVVTRHVLSQSIDAVSVATNFVKLNEEYCTYNAKVQIPPHSISFRSVAGWIPPTQNGVKVNVDAHIMEGIGLYFGVVIRDGMGSLKVDAAREVMHYGNRKWPRRERRGMEVRF